MVSMRATASCVRRDSFATTQPVPKPTVHHRLRDGLTAAAVRVTLAPSLGHILRASLLTADSVPAALCPVAMVSAAVESLVPEAVWAIPTVPVMPRWRVTLNGTAPSDRTREHATLVPLVMRQRTQAVCLWTVPAVMSGGLGVAVRGTPLGRCDGGAQTMPMTAQPVQSEPLPSTGRYVEQFLFRSTHAIRNRPCVLTATREQSNGIPSDSSGLGSVHPVPWVSGPSKASSARLSPARRLPS